MSILQDPRRRGLVAVGLLALLVLALVAPFAVYASQRHLSAYADGEEDASHALDELGATSGHIESIVSSPHLLSDVQDPRHTLLLVMGVERPYDAGEAAAVVSFLRAGGNVILADESGFGTAIAQKAGFAFDSSRVLDSNNHRGDTKLVVVNSTLDGRTYRLLLNAPSDIIQLPDHDVNSVTLAASSASDVYPAGSYRDVNGNGEIDKSDPSGPFPLIVSTELGAGKLVLVADTGLFMNRQVDLAEYENGAYLRALAGTMVPRDGTILVDESRHAPSAPLALMDDAARALGRVSAGTLVTYVALVLLVGATLLFVFFTRTTDDWTHHAHDIGALLPAPENVQPDHARATRMARRRISEKHNIPMEQVAAMSAEQLHEVCGDRVLAESAAGTLRGDPAPVFRACSIPSPQTPEALS